MRKSFKAIIIGSTGSVGKNVLKNLVESPLCTSIKVINRRKVDLQLPKCQEHVVDFNKLSEELKPILLDTEVAFSTMGVGQPRKAGKQEFIRVDKELTLEFAKSCREAGIKHLSLLGSVGSDPNSKSNWYLKTKGEVEEELKSLNFERCSIFRPSLLVTKEIRYGLQDRITQFLFPKISFLFPLPYHEIKVEDLGKCFVKNSEIEKQGFERLEYPDFIKFLE